MNLLRHRDKIWRAVLGAGVLLIILMCLFPPYNYVYMHRESRLEEPVRATRDAGYYFIASPPELNDAEFLGNVFGLRSNGRPFVNFSTEIDIRRLAIQGVAVLVLTVGLAIIFYRR